MVGFVRAIARGGIRMDAIDLGTVIYSDGSMASVESCSGYLCNNEERHIYFRPIPARRLLQAPFETGRP